MRLAAIIATVLLFVGPALPAPDELEDAFRSLQEAQSKKDAALVKKLAAQTCALARKEIAAPAPESESDKEAWTKRVAYARGIELNAEYALYSTAVQGPPAITVELLSALEGRTPEQVPGAGVRPLFPRAEPDRRVGEDSCRRRKGHCAIPRQ